MAHTTLSNNGRIVIPKPFRDGHNWKPGQQLEIFVSDNGILLKPATKPFTTTTLAEVAACLVYQDKGKSLADMEEAIRHGALETANAVPQNFHELKPASRPRSL